MASWREVFGRAPVAATLATWFGVGLVPGPAGTWGSLAAVPLAEGAFRLGGLPGLIAFAVAATLVGIAASGRTSALRRDGDPHEVVIDEVAGQALAQLGLHAAFPALALDLRGWGLVFLSFFLFRLLDVVKPGPIHRLQSLPGGAGIVLDDVAAGAVAGLAMAAVSFVPGLR